jgi:hypothetical protein
MLRVQSNDPRDLYRAGFNESQVLQQRTLGAIGDGSLAGGSWSQPPWRGWHPIIGAAKPRGSEFLARYAQDGDSGFFYRRGLFGRGEPIGVSPFPPNHLYDTPDTSLEDSYTEPIMSTAVPEIVEPSPTPFRANLEEETLFTPEPQQRATHVPPYSHLIVQGLGKSVSDEKSALFEEPFEIPEYKGGFHKKSRRFDRR